MYQLQHLQHSRHARAKATGMTNHDPGDNMPILHLQMHPGRTDDQKRAFVREATKAAVETLACPPESLEILITEIAKDSWAVGGRLKSEA
ncbi:4-oxalocrotonate tautomerase [Rhizobium binxianense]|uniref:4-oxalocrotonate tautomerase n=1 Tax=Rhizobium binxianense TaxID=3024242 RepID=UPI002362C389|nr:4-oxalocrotonate tautomerase [Rhizobium sp. MC62]MDC9812965.1 4-oxalocrotonate tautomerase [Rhizobium sp. MC62]